MLRPRVVGKPPDWLRNSVCSLLKRFWTPKLNSPDFDGRQESLLSTSVHDGKFCTVLRSTNDRALLNSRWRGRFTEELICNWWRGGSPQSCRPVVIPLALVWANSNSINE